MLNNVVLVGRITKKPEYIITEQGKKRTKILLAITRTFTNSYGIYETDFINVILWNSIAESTCEYCQIGDIVGIKGRLQSYSREKEKEVKIYNEIIAEKITFLTSNKTK